MQPKKLSSKLKNRTLPSSPKSSGNSYLNVLLLAPNASNILHTIALLIAKYKCNIVNNRVIDLGSYLSFAAGISGKWHLIHKLEVAINHLIAKNLDCNIYLKRDLNFDHSPAKNCPTRITYLIQATTINKPEILSSLLSFFYKEQLLIKEINIDNLDPTINLINLTIKVKVPINKNILTLREIFLTYCENLNLDTSLEPLGTSS